MPNINTLSKQQRQALKNDLEAEYQAVCDKALSLDMTRGKPSTAQLDLSNDLLSLPGNGQHNTSNGQDCRNYGGLDGIPEMKALFSAILDAPENQIIIGGSASLTMMYDCIIRACLFGVSAEQAPWEATKSKFLCPSPGYDRHFAITETLGFELIIIDMLDDGPDMDQVEKLVASDASIKGIWCVPKYSNPTGATYSDETVNRLASMKTAADDFRIMWDNAYAEHHLDGELDLVASLLGSCKEAGTPDRAYLFSSTSKITFASAGVAAFASSLDNITYAKQKIGIQAIGPDKINQLRHHQFLKGIDGLRNHMNKHADLLKPRFDQVEKVLNKTLSGWDIATWTQPTGGYFISLDLKAGSAKNVVALCKQAGVVLTTAGATFPYGNDPQDRNIRIAPSFPEVDEIEAAMEVFALCVKLDGVG